jgi:hypothetical protein
MPKNLKLGMRVCCIPCAEEMAVDADEVVWSPASEIRIVQDGHQRKQIN